MDKLSELIYQQPTSPRWSEMRAQVHHSPPATHECKIWDTRSTLAGCLCAINSENRSKPCV